MNTNMLDILIQTIKSRLVSFVAKFKRWTSWTFIRSRIVIKLRDFFFRLLGVKPRDKDDYFTIGRWMISKRLLYAGVIIIGAASIWYITSEAKLFSRFDESGVRTYKYNSVRLRAAKGRVRITGKSGYLAYEGSVAGGQVSGEGILYNPAGNIVYTGQFDENKYEGNGMLNYPSGSLRYRGGFHENLFEGEGTLYRENGTRNYVGQFSYGLFNGAGTLYDSGENELYTGTFTSGEIMYSELLGKTAAETASYYKGSRELYYTDDETAIRMNDIDALCYLVGDPEALDEEEYVDSVYILNNKIGFSNTSYNTITGLTEAMGDPIYEGNSGVIFPEAVCVNILNERDTALNGPVEMNVSRSFSDAALVENYDRDYAVYIYTFRRGGLLFSFVCEDKGNYFDFFYITKDQENT